MKTTTIFVCTNCDAQAPKWQGRCSECGAWGTLVEQTPAAASSPTAAIRGAAAGTPIAINEITTTTQRRLPCGIGEVDRVLGGGFVPGSLVLLGGEPGIGKSTLVLQITETLSGPIIYVSGEESPEQIKDRIDRLEIKTQRLSFLPETNVLTIAATLIKEKPTLAIIDSIQTLHSPDVPSGAGSVNQVRACTTTLLEVAKKHGVTILIIGHVTKEGEVAGPRTLEHLVDTVLYLEGDRHHTFRILRGVKNRFGSTFEVGIFEMRGSGLAEVTDPAAVFLTDRLPNATGTIITPVLEGSRVFMLEVQALVSPTSFGFPQRKTYGLDLNRAQLLIAVLTRRLNLKLGSADIYLNLIGGMKVTEPALDLPIMLAIISAAKDLSVPPTTIALGEVGLGGEVRPVPHLDKRLHEAKKLGFTRAIIPQTKNIKPPAGMTIIAVKTLAEAAKTIAEKN